MKKSVIWSIIIAVIVIAGGGFVFYNHESSNHTNVSTSAYATQMSQGKDAAKEEKYDDAADHFNRAYELKATSEAKTYAKQAENMSDAITYAKRAHYTTALTSVQKVIDAKAGYQVLTTKGKELKTTLTKVEENYENEIQPLQDAAQKAEANKDWQKAINNYEEILELSYINGKYYQAIKKDAEASIKADKKKLKEAKENKASAKSSTSSNAASSSSDSRYSENDHTVNGSNVSLSTQDQIRNRLKALGISPNPWSPQDLINLYRYATTQGHKTPNDITKSDVENYLKP